MKNCILASVVLATGISLCIAGKSHAGPLNPPFGAVTSTGKTLSEIEPRMPIGLATTPGDADSMYRIVTSGSYYLTGNIFANSGKSGIEIAASAVTIDLNGFRIQGSPTSLDGITEDASLTVHTGIRITNGNIQFVGGHGVNLHENGDSAQLDHLRIYSCGSMGIHCGLAATVEHCTVAFNSSTGVGVYGTSAAVRDCNSFGNGGVGVFCNSTAVISDCSANNNSTAGFRTGNGAAISHCSARENGAQGFDIGTDGTLDACSAYGNVTHGFDAGLNCTISGCTSAFNQQDGILIASGIVSGCSCYANTNDGIEAAGDSKIRDNACDSNGNGGDGAGIHVTGSDNVIEANHCTDTDRGIEVASAGNLIIRNVCASNAVDWVIAANNVYGPIIDRRGATTAAVNGFSAASTLSSTDANANFSH